MDTVNKSVNTHSTLRRVGLAASAVTVVAAMQSGLPGSEWFAVISLAAIALATVVLAVSHVGRKDAAHI